VAIFEGDKAAPGVSPIKGEITFTQIENAETMVLVRLRKTNITVPTTLSHKWHVHVNRPNNTDYTCQLGSAGGHYDPLNMLSQANYATECAKNQMKCEMGDLVGKGGALDFKQIPTAHFYTDINLPVMGSSPGIAGRSVVIHAHDVKSNKIACASIIYMGKFSPRKAVAKFDVANVAKGTITFSQMSMTSPTHVMVDLMEMKGGAAGYHVHMYPMASAAAGCGPESTGGHFNPNNGATPCNPLISYNCEYGDLSGKHGSLSAGTASSQSYFDFDLPMFGKDSIIGRSVVIHNSAGSRVACANIDFIGKTMKSVATFESNQPVSGTIMFTNFEGSSETSVFVDLQKDDKSNSSGHKWHVHEKSVPSSGACADTGGHYDPYAVKTSRPNYGTVCSNGAGASGQQLGCEVGDLVLKSKPLDFSATGVSRFFYTDLQLPVTNPTANEAGIGGRSITLHVSDEGAGRYTCGSVAYSGSTDNTPASAGPTSDGSSSTSFGDETWHIAVVSAGGAVIVMLGLFMLMKKTGSA
jgi:Cu/Zn superoxide dismutase